MTETVNPATPTPSFHIHRIYLKGTSLEIPHAPQIFLEAGEVGLDFKLVPIVNELGNNLVEATLRGTLTATVKDQTLYLLEVDQAGVFEIQHVHGTDRQALLEVNAMAVLTSYLRTQLADTLQRAQMLPFLLPEINWAGAFLERQTALAANVPA